MILHGADPSYITTTGKNVLHVCVSENSITCSGIILQSLIITSSFDNLEALFRGTDEDQNAPLHLACKSGNLDFGSHLFSCGCPWEIRKNSAGYRPIDLAILSGQKILGCLMLLRTPSNEINTIEEAIPLNKKFEFEYRNSYEMSEAIKLNQNLHIPNNWKCEKIGIPLPQKITPPSFIHQLVELGVSLPNDIDQFLASILIEMIKNNQKPDVIRILNI